jgi:hypothetical protein
LKQETGQDFLDGGFYNNCPAKIALSERQLLWGDVGDAHPDILLSLGTGHKLVDTDPAREVGNAATKQHRSIISRTWGMAGNLLEDQLECDKAWDDVVRQATGLCGKDRELVSRYVRLNVDIPRQVPRLDEVKRVEELEALVYAKEPNEAREVAHRLIASSFFCFFQQMPPGNKGRSRMHRLQGELESLTFSPVMIARCGLTIHTTFSSSEMQIQQRQSGVESPRSISQDFMR